MFYINNNKLDTVNLTDNNFFVIMDFDRTITTIDSMGSWSVFENPNFVNPKFKEDSNSLIEKYYPYELNYSLNKDVKAKYIHEWYVKNMNLFYEYNLTYTTMLDCVKNSNIKFRDGFNEFISDLYNKNIPAIILSAGIGNVIVELLKLNNCYYDNITIISNFIKFENNKILPFTDKMITSSNKSIDFSKIDSSIFNSKYILLFGDLIEDLQMVPQEYQEKTISFGFLETNIKENFDYYKNAFDIVLTDNSSFNDVKNILDTMKL